MDEAVQGSGAAASCPSCGKPSLVLTTFTQEVPHFGEVLHTVVRCEACGFRHTDFFPLSARDPARHTLVIRSDEDLSARVVRSASGTYRIPELGFLAEPAPSSEAFVSNVEGVLERVREVLIRARLFADDPEKRRLLDERLSRLQAVMEHREIATLVLEDPHGHSAILSDRAEVTPLSPDEAARLNLGAFVLDADR